MSYLTYVQFVKKVFDFRARAGRDVRSVDSSYNALSASSSQSTTSSGLLLGDNWSSSQLAEASALFLSVNRLHGQMTPWIRELAFLLETSFFVSFQRTLESSCLNQLSLRYSSSLLLISFARRFASRLS